MMQEDESLWALFIGSFVAASLLPGGSEALLFAVLQHHTDVVAPALALATAGNTLGGMTSYLLGRILPPVPADVATRTGRWRARALSWARRHGAPAMLAAWLPLLGDPLCVAAGWLRLNWLAVLIFMAAGKLARYCFIAWVAL
jgi:membrane protein YqaA with SNARE-associated domain